MADLNGRCDYSKVFTVSFVRMLDDWKPFTIHRDMATKTSKLFKNAADALPQHWGTHEPMLMELRAGGPKIIQIYAHWAYTGKVVIDDHPEYSGAPVA